MDYSFAVEYNENYMVNYFKGTSGLNIKDTLIVNIRNSGSKGWMAFKGSFRCVEEKSNLFFDETLIAEEAYPNGRQEIVLNFSRTAKNKNHGNCFTTIQLTYKGQRYNEVTIRFIKDYDLFGNKLEPEQMEQKEEGKEEPINIIVNKPDEEKEQNIQIGGGFGVVGDKQVEEGKIEKEEEKKIQYFQPENIKEKLPNKEEEKREKKDDEHAMIIKFRSAFQFSKLDYPDEYLKGLLDKAKNDFQTALMIHLENEDLKTEENKKKSKNEDGLNSLLVQFRKEYQLSPDDYPDDVIKKALQKKEGNFNNAFEELMSFIA
jgi:hypothetical protein